MKDAQGHWRHDGDCPDGEPPKEPDSLIAHNALGQSKWRFGLSGGSIDGPDPRAIAKLKEAGVRFTRTFYKDGLPGQGRVVDKVLPLKDPPKDGPPLNQIAFPLPPGEEETPETPALAPINPAYSQTPLSAAHRPRTGKGPSRESLTSDSEFGRAVHERRTGQIARRDPKDGE